MTIPKVLGLSGKARSGKGTVARFLSETYGYKVASFATPLKEGARVVFGFTADQVYGEAKELVDPYWGFTPRYALQLMGTEAFRRTFGADVWVRVMRRYVARLLEAGAERVVIDDVRFPNEAVAIHEWGGEVWRLERTDGPGAQGGVQEHESETALDHWTAFDLTVKAPTGVPGLLTTVAAAVAQRYSGS